MGEMKPLDEPDSIRIHRALTAVELAFGAIDADAIARVIKGWSDEANVLRARVQELERTTVALPTTGDVKLVRISGALADAMSLRADDCSRLSVAWLPLKDGTFDGVVTRHADDNPLKAAEARVLELEKERDEAQRFTINEAELFSSAIIRDVQSSTGKESIFAGDAARVRHIEHTFADATGRMVNKLFNLALAASQAECAKYREALERISNAHADAAYSDDSQRLAVFNAAAGWTRAALSRSPGSMDALREVVTRAGALALKYAHEPSYTEGEVRFANDIVGRVCTEILGPDKPAEPYRIKPSDTRSSSIFTEVVAVETSPAKPAEDK